jgi:hypothetical protein
VLVERAELIKGYVRGAIRAHTNWPVYMVEWHMRRLQIIAVTGDSMFGILNNVNMPWRPKGCACQAFRESLKANACAWTPPMVDGHVFFIGREYQGPYAHALQTANTNIPNTTTWDVKRTLTKSFGRLPIPLELPAEEIERIVGALTGAIKIKRDRMWPTSAEVYKLRKTLKGLVIGGLDKNLGEFSVCCPCLYDKALRKMYSKETGYEEVHIRKVRVQHRKTHGPTDLLHCSICNADGTG